MTHDRQPPASGGTPPAPASTEPAPAPRARVYEPPEILWEQPFVALAQVSFRGDYGCDIPGSCEDLP
ncbi:hypothetical protein [Archangium sp.]|uniref:hypothetical protein n=1 Tax=Archangium sp. TaxID=1872627 RepID=UPI002D56A697|nr:hypothetical protein [Archangium sp.]HYO52336.1 hypothetical protein [Archangium sp.]